MPVVLRRGNLACPIRVRVTSLLCVMAALLAFAACSSETPSFATCTSDDDCPNGTCESTVAGRLCVESDGELDADAGGDADVDASTEPPDAGDVDGGDPGERDPEEDIRDIDLDSDDVDAEVDVDADADVDDEPDLEFWPDVEAFECRPCETGIADCDDGEICFGGCCENVDPCETPGQRCTLPRQTTDALVCDTRTRFCVERCFDALDFAPYFAGCPRGTTCAPVTGDSPSLMDGACVPGDCGGVFDECGSGRMCLPVQHGFASCTDVGAIGEGGVCGTAVDCEPGLMCAYNRCERPCAVGAASSCDTGECMPVLGAFPLGVFGFCREPCVPGGEDCGEGEACTPGVGLDGPIQWSCRTVSEPARIGELCEGVDCADGLICAAVGREAGGARLRCAEACDIYTGAGCDVPEEQCIGSRDTSFAFCAPPCAPFPQREEADCYANPAFDYACYFATTGLPGEVTEGYCAPDPGTADYGEPCTIDADCTDNALCRPGGTANVCTPQCRAFHEGDCPAGWVCQGVYGLVGYATSLCGADVDDAALGDACTRKYAPCQTDGSVCLDVAATGDLRCEALCRLDQGSDDCATLAPGTACMDVLPRGTAARGVGACR